MNLARKLARAATRGVRKDANREQRRVNQRNAIVIAAHRAALAEADAHGDWTTLEVPGRIEAGSAATSTAYREHILRHVKDKVAKARRLGPRPGSR